MNWKKILLIIGVVILLLLIILIAVFYPGSSGYYTNKARENGDLSYCNKIPFFKIYTRYYEGSFGMLPGHYAIKTQRRKCREIVMAYFVNEEDLSINAKAIRDNNPSLCLEIADDSKNKNVRQACIKRIIDRYRDPGTCEWYTQFRDVEDIYRRYHTEITCKIENIIAYNKGSEFCKEYSTGLKEYCYYSVVSYFNKNKLDFKKPDGTEVYLIKPDAPFVCDSIDAYYRGFCEDAYRDFNSWTQ